MSTNAQRRLLRDLQKIKK